MQSLADSLPRSQLHLCGRVCHLHHKDSVLEGNPPEGCDAGREEPWTDEGADDDVVEPISPQRLRGGGDVAIPDGGVAAMRMADLQKALRERNLTTRGGKADLVVRLQEALDRDRAGGGGMNKRSMSPTADAKKAKVAYKKPKKNKGPIETKQGIELLKVRKVLLNTHRATFSFFWCIVASWQVATSLDLICGSKCAGDQGFIYKRRNLRDLLVPG
jgi:hypothetical protein